MCAATYEADTSRKRSSETVTAQRDVPSTRVVAAIAAEMVQAHPFIVFVAPFITGRLVCAVDYRVVCAQRLEDAQAVFPNEDAGAEGPQFGRGFVYPRCPTALTKCRRRRQPSEPATGNFRMPSMSRKKTPRRAGWSNSDSIARPASPSRFSDLSRSASSESWNPTWCMPGCRSPFAWNRARFRSSHVPPNTAKAASRPPARGVNPTMS